MSAPRSPLVSRLIVVLGGLNGAVPIPELLTRITENTRDLLGASSAGLAVREGDTMRMVAGSGDREQLIGVGWPYTGSIAERLVRSGRRSFDAEASQFPYLGDGRFGATPGRMAVALADVNEASLAGLYVIRDEPLTPDELEVLELLAVSAGAALRSAERVKDIEGAKDLFLATASHELRTPLTVLRGYGETLLNHWDVLSDERRQEIVATILSRTAAMTGLVEQLLLGSRAGMGMEVKVRQFDLAAAVRVAAKSIAGARPSHPLEIDAPQEVPAYGDENTVDAILGQLVENAVKYTPDGGPISISVCPDGGDAVLRVADTGVGIAEEDLERVFDRFMRSDVGRGAANGAGLGLWIVRRYLEAQGGSVVAQGRPGGGTIIEVRLPLA